MNYAGESESTTNSNCPAARVMGINAPRPTQPQQLWIRRSEPPRPHGIPLRQLHLHRRYPFHAVTLLLAAADRQGRIALLDFRLKSAILWFDTDSKKGVQDLCWAQARPDSYLLAAINGPSTLSLYNASTGRCFWKYDASPEYLSCVRRDPFDSRHICAVGLRGFLLSVVLLGDTDDAVVIKELQIPTDSSELAKFERDATAGSSTSAVVSPAAAAFPSYVARLAFSQQWRHILFVTFPRELVVFDLQYETVVFSTALPRGCGKFLDVLPDPSNDWIYCAHRDGKLSTWRRKT